MSEPTTEIPAAEISTEEKPVTFSVYYSCMRCGTNVSQSELSRSPVVKTIKAF
jgi:DNA-directed RNA polymerase subunit P